MTSKKRSGGGLTLMTDEEGFVDSTGRYWSLADLKAEDLDVAYVYKDKKGKLWMRLKSHEHITPPNKHFDS
jgi:hypothetical protein